MDQNSKVITVNDVINFIKEDSSKMAALIKGTSTNIKKIVETVDNSEIKSSTKKLKAFEGYVDRYNNIISSIIRSFTTDLINGNDSRSLNDLLGAQIEEVKGDDGKVIKKTRYTTIEAMNQIPTLLNMVFKNIETIVGFDMKMRTGKVQRRIRQNMLIMRDSLVQIVDTIKDTFLTLDFDQDFKDILAVLTNEPQTVIDTSKSIYKTDKDDKGNLITNKVKDTTNKITKDGRVGLIDCISNLFNMIAMIGMFKAPSIRSIKKTIKKVGAGLGKIAELLIEPIRSFNTHQNDWAAFAESMNGENSFMDAIQQFPMIVKILQKAFPVGMNVILKLMEKSVLGLKAVIVNLHNEIMNDENIISFSDKTMYERLMNLKKNLSLISDTTILLTSLLGPLTSIIILKKIYRKGIASLLHIFEGVSTLFNKIEGKNINENIIKDLDAGLTAIREMVGSAIKTGLMMTQLIFVNKLIKGGIKRLTDIILKLSYFTKVISKYNIDEVTGKISSIFLSLNGSFKNIIEIGKRSIIVSLMCDYIKEAISKIGSILKRVRDIVKFVNKNNFDSEQLELIDKSTGALSRIFLNLSKIGPHAIILLLLQDVIIEAMASIAVIFDEYTQLLSIIREKKFNSRDVLLLAQAVRGLANITKDFMKLALLALPATLAVKISLIFVKALHKFVHVLIRTFNKDLSIKKVRKGIYHIGDIIEELMKVSGLIMLFALISPVVALASIVAIVGVLAIWAFVKMVSILFRSITKSLLIHTIKFAMVFGLITLVLLAAAVSLVAVAQAASVVLKSIGQIFLFIACIAGVALAMLLLGATLSLLSPIMMVAMIGLGAMILMLTTLWFVTILLDKIASYNLDKNVIKNSMDAIVDSIKTISEALTTNIGSSLKAARSGKRILRQIRRTFKHIKSIAKTLNFIQNLSIDKGKINSNVDNIMICVGNLESKLAEFNGIKENVKQESNLLEQIKTARLQKRTFRQNKKMLSKVDKVLVEINDIAEKLKFLSEFKIKDIEGAVKDNVSNIFSLIDSLNGELTKFNGVENVKNEGNLLAQIKTARLQKRAFRQNKKMLSKVDNILVEINNIAEKIKFLSEFKIEDIKDNVTKNIEGIFTFVGELKTKISDFIKPEGAPENTNLIDQIQNSRLQKKMFRQSKKMLNKIDGVLVEITNIAEKIKFLNEFKLTPDDKTSIYKGISDIFGFIGDLRGKIQTFLKPTDQQKESSLIKRIFKKKKEDKLLQNTSEKLSKVDSVLVEISNISEKIKFLNEFKLEATQRQSILNNVNELFNFVEELRNNIINFNKPDTSQNSNVGLFDKIGQVVDNFKANRKFNKNQKTITKTGGVILEIYEIAKSLDFLNTLKINKDLITKNVDAVIGCVTEISSKVKNNPFKLDNNSTSSISFIKSLNDSIKDISNISADQVSNTEKTLNNYGKFIEKINTVKVENLEKSTAMFQQMARFSESIEGNFEKLADVINEKLMPLLQEMKEVSNDTTKKLETGFANTSATMAATAAGPMNQSTMTAQVQRENPNMSKKDIEKMVDNRMKDQAKNQAQSLTAKIDEVIELLQGSGKIKVVPV